MRGDIAKTVMLWGRGCWGLKRVIGFHWRFCQQHIFSTAECKWDHVGRLQFIKSQRRQLVLIQKSAVCAFQIHQVGSTITLEDECSHNKHCNVLTLTKLNDCMLGGAWRVRSDDLTNFLVAADKIVIACECYHLYRITISTVTQVNSYIPSSSFPL